jgi:antirestriction protein ArdC
MSGAEKTRQLVDAQLDRLAAALEAGESEQLKAYLAAIGRFRRYSIGNVLLISMACPHATRVAGYRTWQQLGRQVKKGEKGISILAPIIARWKNDSDEDEERVVAFRGATVFDISQTDGQPLPEFAKVRGDPGAYAEQLRQMIADSGIVLEYSADMHGAEGFCSGGRIVIREGLSQAEEFSVLVHEWAHARLHTPPEGRPQSRTVRETEAEAVAFVVSSAIGLDVGTSSSDYLRLYDGKKETLIESLERIRRVAAEIIDGIQERIGRQVGEVAPAAQAIAA